MEKKLSVLGSVIFIICSILGIVSGSLLILILSVMGGIIAAMICYALSDILKNQDIIKNELYKIHSICSKLIEKKTCSKCNELYDSDMSYCPHCGHN